MRFTPAQIIAMTTEPGDNHHSMLQSLYAEVARGDLPARQKERRSTGGRDALYFSLTDACVFKVLYALGQVGIAAATPMNQVALSAMLNWSAIRPPVGTYENPIAWAIEHVKAGGDVALGLYSVAELDGPVIVGAMFDTDESIIPDLPRVRVALNLSDLLRSVLSGAEALQSRVVN